jgi:glycosyltransferase involved in cell wall biosynthesis
MKLSAVIPCYNDENVLHALSERLRSVFMAQEWDYEILFVDDGSGDGTWQIIRELSLADNHIIGIRLSRNHGHQLALTAGMAKAVGDRILMIDSDLQDPPELVPAMMKLMNAGADVVYGQRRSRRGVPHWKKFAYKIFYKLLSQLAGSDIPPDTGDFRLISRSVADLLQAMPEQYRFIRGMVSWLGYKQVPLLYDRQARHAGESHYTLRKLFHFAFDGITSFSIQPLRVASLFALFIGSLAICGLIFIIVGWWMHRPVQGWTSLSVIILFLGSMQLFVLGIIGEYLGRLFIESKRRPLYIIAEVVGRKSDVS